MSEREDTRRRPDDEGGSGTPEEKWTRADVLRIFCEGDGGSDRSILDAIRNERYTICCFDKARDRWRHDDGSETENELPRLRGNTDRRNRKIRINKCMTAERAACTLFHELGHVRRGATATRDEHLEQEIEVRVETEEFKRRHGMPATPNYREADGTVDRDFIANQIRNSSHYNPVGKRRIGRTYEGEREVTGWRCP